MKILVIKCNEFLQNNGFDYAFCGGHAIDIALGKCTRPHGDIDISAFWEDRNNIIKFMQKNDWIIYEALGEGKIYLIKDTNDQKLIKLNIFCVKDECSFFHIEHIGENIYKCEIDHIEQKK